MKKFSLEHSIRNIITESVGNINDLKTAQPPKAVFNKPVSIEPPHGEEHGSMKALHVSNQRKAAKQNDSLTRNTFAEENLNEFLKDAIIFGSKVITKGAPEAGEMLGKIFKKTAPEAAEDIAGKAPKTAPPVEKPAPMPDIAKPAPNNLPDVVTPTKPTPTETPSPKVTPPVPAEPTPQKLPEVVPQKPSTLPAEAPETAPATSPKTKTAPAVKLPDTATKTETQTKVAPETKTQTQTQTKVATPTSSLLKTIAAIPAGLLPSGGNDSQTDGTPKDAPNTSVPLHLHLAAARKASDPSQSSSSVTKQILKRKTMKEEKDGSEERKKIEYVARGKLDPKKTLGRLSAIKTRIIDEAEEIKPSKAGKIKSIVLDKKEENLGINPVVETDPKLKPLHMAEDNLFEAPGDSAFDSYTQSQVDDLIKANPGAKDKINKKWQDAQARKTASNTNTPKASTAEPPPPPSKPAAAAAAPEAAEAGAATAGKTVGGFAKKAAGPVIGAGLDYGLEKAAGRSSARAAGHAIASTAGMIGGGILGSAGGPAGTIAGGIAGDLAAGHAYDKIVDKLSGVPDEDPRKKPVDPSKVPSMSGPFGGN